MSNKYLSRLQGITAIILQVIMVATNHTAVRDGAITETVLMEDILLITEEDTTELTIQSMEVTLTGVMTREEDTRRNGIGTKHTAANLIMLTTEDIIQHIIMELKRLITDIILTGLMVMRIMEVEVTTQGITSPAMGEYSSTSK
jgi:hypothetical protein